ncbi:redox-sensitive transcriptional activator SoxR [Sphingomonas crocodyli]|uniref:Redox-sensitive transcriptional activator SoxR n=1 Tax=Sphingomonas crocodyli TaxID=1979270 RepID=A0A437M6R6_9SPHN|nr:redox-sensitive transcriptional activator SoxR [Sphingomonas crocodyli]RVT93372.1 redox-sensitive transcriptional activator SoxR [Sphingomonas crocodyli]
MAVKTALTVGDVAKRSGVPVSTIHFYEAEGLIHGWRTAGNQRRYERAVLRYVALIQVSQRVGLSLRTIKDFFATIPTDRVLSAQDWHRLAEPWRALIDARIETLRRLRDEVDSCIGCGCLSLTDCPLRNPEDRLAGQGAGPRILMRPPAKSL